MANPSWYPEPKQAAKITDFILWFSRFEYALKNGGYHRPGPDDLKPDWAFFQAYFANKPIPNTLRTEFDYLKNKPPKIQKTANMAWQPMGYNSDWGLLIGSLQVVRNNLFHGGKHYNGQIIEPARDQTLIEYCQNIMIKILPICPPSIQNYFA